MLETTSGTAQLKSFDEFLAAFNEADPAELLTSKTLLLPALSNMEPQARYPISTFLLDRGVSADGQGVERSNAFSILFTRPELDVDQTVELTVWLIQAGADPNLPDDRKRTPTAYLVKINIPYDKTPALYDVWFVQPGIDLTFKNVAGVSAPGGARTYQNSDLVSRMETYLEQRS